MPDTTCPDNPPPPLATADDKEIAAYIRKRWDAGDACRDKLRKVDETIKGWPKP